MNVQISFVGHPRTNMNAYFPWSRACVCTKSRVAKIRNVKVSFSVLFSYYVLAVGGERNATGDGETNTGPEVIQHAVSIPALSSLLLEKRRGMKVARGDARTCFSVRSQILIDSYICDQ